jgi:predicted transcriptional regulator
MFKINDRYLIKTPTGYESFKGVQKKNVTSMFTFTFTDGTFIKCSGGHRFLTDEGFKTAKQITLSNTLTNKIIKSIDEELGKFEVFDPVGVDKHETYISNDIISHNTEFLGSTNTLISGEKLATLVYKTSVAKMADVVIYERPIKEEFDDETMDQISTDHMYAMVVDVSEGKNLDYSAFSVFDVSTIPYKQVAVYRNNTIPPMVFPNVIKTCAEYYNDAHVLIEINNSPQVAEILLEDLEYENVFKVKSGNKKAQTITLGAGRGIAYGLKTSPLTKRIGCSTLKTLIENDKLVINDFETISELTTFVNNGKSFSAEEGCNDDIVMTLVNFGWLVTQRLFKELVENDIRKQLQLEHFEYIDEDQLPLGENYKGNDIPFYIEDDAVWVEVGKHSSKDPYGDIFKNLINF